jgi:hypothetical protein
MAPPIIAKIKSMIPLDISTINDNDNRALITKRKDELAESNPYVRFNLEYPESAIFPPNDNLDNKLESKEEGSTDNYDPNRVF